MFFRVTMPGGGSRLVWINVPPGMDILGVQDWITGGGVPGATKAIVQSLNQLTVGEPIVDARLRPVGSIGEEAGGNIISLATGIELSGLPGPGGADPDPTPARIGGLEQESASAAFQAFLPTIDPSFTPTGQPSRARSAAERQFAPFISAFAVQNPLTGLGPGVQEGTEFETFLGRQQGIDPLQALRGAFTTAQGRTAANLQSPFPAGDPVLGVIRPQSFRGGEGQPGGDRLANLALALQQRAIAPILRSSTGSQSPSDLFGRFAAGRENLSSTEYVDFLRNFLGLERLGAI